MGGACSCLKGKKSSFKPSGYDDDFGQKGVVVANKGGVKIGTNA